MLKLYFLFLIKDKFNNLEIWQNFFKNASNYQILIHPKLKNKKTFLDLNEKILNPIDTKWGDISLADAEVYLMKEALLLNDSPNSYYILLSDDCVPLTSFIDLYNFLNSQTLSFFNAEDYVRGTKKLKRRFIFSSQFFCANYTDVKTVVLNYKKYRLKFKKFNKIYSPDETFMLSILFYENKEYEFVNEKFIQLTTFFYRETIPEISDFVNSYNKFMKKLYNLKETKKISDIQQKAFDKIFKFKKYGILHPYTFLYEDKLIDKFKKHFPNSFFLRKVISDENKYYNFKLKDILYLKSYFDSNDYEKIINQLKLF